jgi:hypothetical protein
MSDLLNNALTISLQSQQNAAEANQRAQSATKNAAELAKKARESIAESGEKTFAVIDAKMKNMELKQTIVELKQKITEQEKVIERQKEVMKEWMISQLAFKSLFKKYGKLPDGDSCADLPAEKWQQIVDQALTEARAQIEAKAANKPS